MSKQELQVEASTRVIHVFDREGDITEVFDQVRQLKHTGVLVRAAHNRSLDKNSERLWDKMESEPIRFTQEIDVPATGNSKGRKANLAVRFCAVNLRTPYRFDNRDPLKVYAAYATEIDCPEGETPLSWMLLTTEVVADVNMAATILRWYTYRWRVEDYQKILKSGCQSERYRLAAAGMKTLLGFLSVIAVELTVAWAVEAVAYLGGYLEHRRKTPIGIQVLWRGWLKLHDLCEGWQLARGT